MLAGIPMAPKPDIATRHFDEIAELSEIYLPRAAETVEFSEDDLLSNLAALYWLSKRENSKMKKSHAKKVESLIMNSNAFASKGDASGQRQTSTESTKSVQIKNTPALQDFYTENMPAGFQMFSMLKSDLEKVDLSKYKELLEKEKVVVGSKEMNLYEYFAGMQKSLIERLDKIVKTEDVDGYNAFVMDRPSQNAFFYLLRLNENIEAVNSSFVFTSTTSMEAVASAYLNDLPKDQPKFNDFINVDAASVAWNLGQKTNEIKVSITEETRRALLSGLLHNSPEMFVQEDFKKNVTNAVLFDRYVFTNILEASANCGAVASKIGETESQLWAQAATLDRLWLWMSGGMNDKGNKNNLAMLSDAAGKYMRNVYDLGLLAVRKNELFYAPEPKNENPSFRRNPWVGGGDVRTGKQAVKDFLKLYNSAPIERELENIKSKKAEYDSKPLSYLQAYTSYIEKAEGLYSDLVQTTGKVLESSVDRAYDALETAKMVTLGVNTALVVASVFFSAGIATGALIALGMSDLGIAVAAEVKEGATTSDILKNHWQDLALYVFMAGTGIKGPKAWYDYGLSMLNKINKVAGTTVNYSSAAKIGIDTYFATSLSIGLYNSCKEYSKINSDLATGEITDDQAKIRRLDVYNGFVVNAGFLAMTVKAGIGNVKNYKKEFAEWKNLDEIKTKVNGEMEKIVAQGEALYSSSSSRCALELPLYAKVGGAIVPIEMKAEYEFLRKISKAKSLGEANKILEEQVTPQTTEPSRQPISKMVPKPANAKAQDIESIGKIAPKPVEEILGTSEKTGAQKPGKQSLPKTDVESKVKANETSPEEFKRLAENEIKLGNELSRDPKPDPTKRLGHFKNAADYYYQGGYFLEAGKLYRAAAVRATGKEVGELFYKAGESFELGGSFKEAGENFYVARNSAKAIENYSRFADECFNAGKFKEAGDQYSQISSLLIKEELKPQWHSKAAESYAKAEQVYSSEGKYKEAGDMCAEVVKHSSEPEAVQLWHSKAVENYAKAEQVYSSEGKFKEAGDMSVNILKHVSDQKSIQVWHSKAEKNYIKSGNYHEIAEMYSNSFRQSSEPKQKLAYKARAKMFYDFENALEAHPESSGFLTLLSSKFTDPLQFSTKADKGEFIQALKSYSEQGGSQIKDFNQFIEKAEKDWKLVEKPGGSMTIDKVFVIKNENGKISLYLEPEVNRALSSLPKRYLPIFIEEAMGKKDIITSLNEKNREKLPEAFNRIISRIKDESAHFEEQLTNGASIDSKYAKYLYCTLAEIEGYKFSESMNSMFVKFGIKGPITPENVALLYEVSNKAMRPKFTIPTEVYEKTFLANQVNLALPKASLESAQIAFEHSKNEYQRAGSDPLSALKSDFKDVLDAFAIVDLHDRRLAIKKLLPADEKTQLSYESGKINDENALRLILKNRQTGSDLSWVFHDIVSKMPPSDAILFEKIASAKPLTQVELNRFAEISKNFDNYIEEYLSSNKITEFEPLIRSTPAFREITKLKQNILETDAKQESEKYDLRLVFSQNNRPLDVFAGTFSGTCLGDHPVSSLARNDVVVATVFKEGQPAGSALFLQRTINGKESLVLFGVDFSESLVGSEKQGTILSTAKIQELTNWMSQSMQAYAKENGFVLYITESGGGISNNTTVKNVLLDNFNKSKEVTFDQSGNLHPTNGYNISSAYPFKYDSPEVKKKQVTNSKPPTQVSESGVGAPSPKNDKTYNSQVLVNEDMPSKPENQSKSQFNEMRSENVVSTGPSEIKSISNASANELIFDFTSSLNEKWPAQSEIILKNQNSAEIFSGLATLSPQALDVYMQMVGRTAKIPVLEPERQQMLDSKAKNAAENVPMVDLLSVDGIYQFKLAESLLSNVQTLCEKAISDSKANGKPIVLVVPLRGGYFLTRTAQLVLSNMKESGNVQSITFTGSPSDGITSRKGRLRTQEGHLSDIASEWQEKGGANLIIFEEISSGSSTVKLSQVAHRITKSNPLVNFEIFSLTSNIALAERVSTSFLPNGSSVTAADCASFRDYAMSFSPVIREAVLPKNYRSFLNNDQSVMEFLSDGATLEHFNNTLFLTQFKNGTSRYASDFLQNWVEKIDLTDRQAVSEFVQWGNGAAFKSEMITDYSLLVTNGYVRKSAISQAPQLRGSVQMSSGNVSVTISSPIQLFSMDSPAFAYEKTAGRLRKENFDPWRLMYQQETYGFFQNMLDCYK